MNNEFCRGLIMDVFSKLSFEKLTESVLGKRGSSGKAFSHGSIFGSLFFSYLCGGECLEDINALIGQFKQRPDTLLPGADTVGRRLKELTEKNIVYKSKTSDKSYSFNTAEKLNTLLLRMIRRMGLIKVGSHVDLDFDHQFIPSLQQGQFFVDDFVASVVGYSRIRFVVDEQRTFLCFHKEG